MKTFPRPIDALLAVLMGIIALSGGWLVVQAMSHEPNVLATAGFEAVVVVTGLAGIAFALGNAREGRSVGLLNLGGVLIVAALTARFAWHTTVTPEALGVRTSVRYAVTDPWFVARGGFGFALIGWSVLLALGSDLISWRRLGLGAILSLPLLAGVALGVRNGFGVIFPAMTDTVSALRLVAGVALTLVFCVLFSVGVHLIIKAFEFAGPANRVPEPPAA
ncbi:MAG: hypothetical protein KDB18_11555 [Salinibacterium sp.]|nr:hypothetical protein [Salinibacterium sp.]